MGYNQAKSLLELARQEKWQVRDNQIVQDFSGNDRVIVLQKRIIGWKISTKFSGLFMFWANYKGDENENVFFRRSKRRIK